MKGEDEHNIHSTTEASSYLPSLGKEFRDQRTSRNISLEQASVDLHIDKRHLIAIENDDFAAVGKRVFIRGYVKIYARYLDLNQDLMLEMLAPHVGEIETTTQTPKFLDANKNSTEHLDYTKAQLNLKTPSVFPSGRILKVSIGMVVLLVLIGGGLVAYVQFFGLGVVPDVVEIDTTSNIVSRNEASEASKPTLQPIAIPEPVYEEKTTDITPIAITQESLNIAPSELASGALTNDTQQILSNNDITIPALTTTSQGQIPEVSLGADRIRIENDLDSWIQITGLNGTLIVEQLYTAKDNPVFLVNLPVDIIIGNASNARMSVNDVLTELNPSATSDVARIRVSRQ